MRYLRDHNRTIVILRYQNRATNYIIICVANPLNICLHLLPRFMQLELFLNSGELSLALYSMVTGILGMNIPYSWNQDHGYMFKWVPTIKQYCMLQILSEIFKIKINNIVYISLVGRWLFLQEFFRLLCFSL